MDIAGFNVLDLVVVAVILLSGVFALARGFVKEVLSIVSWVGAAFATFYGFNAVSAFVQRFIESPMIAGAVAGGTLFLMTLFVLSFISGQISNRVRGSSVGSVDRSLGFVFGLLRGFILISIAYLALSWAFPPAEQPQWVRAAKTMPLLQRGAAVLTALAPTGFGDSQPASRPANERPTNERPARGAQDRPSANPLSAGGGPGYKVDERKEMDRLIQGTQ